MGRRGSTRWLKKDGANEKRLSPPNPSNPMKRPKDRATDCVVEVTKRYYVRIDGMIPLHAGNKVESACNAPDKRKIARLITLDGRPDPHESDLAYRFTGFHEVK